MKKLVMVLHILWLNQVSFASDYGDYQLERLCYDIQESSIVKPKFYIPPNIDSYITFEEFVERNRAIGDELLKEFGLFTNPCIRSIFYSKVIYYAPQRPWELASAVLVASIMYNHCYNDLALHYCEGLELPATKLPIHTVDSEIFNLFAILFNRIKAKYTGKPCAAI